MSRCRIRSQPTAYGVYLGAASPFQWRCRRDGGLWLQFHSAATLRREGPPEDYADGGDEGYDGPDYDDDDDDDGMEVVPA